ncbi:MAG TPA: galactosyldiacylglycerol synthase [Methylomirabilota bacterium]|nr:galactosyldiacylglycerol synthase [Methylomirabilota bacterium]
MIKIYNKSSNELLGRISENDLNFLVEHLEEEELDDPDYYLQKETIEDFEKKGASPKLVEILRSALQGQDAAEIRWERDNLPT